MASHLSPEYEACFQRLAVIKAIHESSKVCHEQFMEHQLLRLKDEELDLDDYIESAYFEMRERQQNR
jgi:hypothetical protein